MSKKILKSPDKSPGISDVFANILLLQQGEDAKRVKIQQMHNPVKSNQRKKAAVTVHSLKTLVSASGENTQLEVGHQFCDNNEAKDLVVTENSCSIESMASETNTATISLQHCQPTVAPVPSTSARSSENSAAFNEQLNTVPLGEMVQLNVFNVEEKEGSQSETKTVDPISLSETKYSSVTISPSSSTKSVGWSMVEPAKTVLLSGNEVMMKDGNTELEKSEFVTQPSPTINHCPNGNIETNVNTSFLLNRLLVAQAQYIAALSRQSASAVCGSSEISTVLRGPNGIFDTDLHRTVLSIFLAKEKERAIAETTTTSTMTETVDYISLPTDARSGKGSISVLSESQLKRRRIRKGRSASIPAATSSPMLAFITTGVEPAKADMKRAESAISPSVLEHGIAIVPSGAGIVPDVRARAKTGTNTRTKTAASASWSGNMSAPITVAAHPLEEVDDEYLDLFSDYDGSEFVTESSDIFWPGNGSDFGGDCTAATFHDNSVLNARHFVDSQISARSNIKIVSGVDNDNLGREPDGRNMF